MSTMNHRDVMIKGLTEKYLLGELSEEEQSEFEEHFFDCPACAEDVRMAALFKENAAAVLETEAFGDTPAEPVGRWQAIFQLFWPVPAGAVALLVICLGIIGVQILVVVPELRGELTLAQSPQAAPSYFLAIARSGGSESPVVTVRPEHRMVGLTLSLSTPEATPYYLVEVLAASGEVVQTAVISSPPPGEEIHLLLPLQQLVPGPLAIVLNGVDTPGGPVVRSELAKYPFVLQIKS